VVTSAVTLEVPEVIPRGLVSGTPARPEVHRSAAPPLKRPSVVLRGPRDTDLPQIRDCLDDCLMIRNLHTRDLSFHEKTTQTIGTDCQDMRFRTSHLAPSLFF
jgi:hypothetical protein